MSKALTSLCDDCGKDTTPCDHRGDPIFKRFDYYIVRDEVWAAAGMHGWKSGYLCTPCLERRLGRKLADNDYLARPGRATKRGLQMLCDPDYLSHPSVMAANGH
jgi:hypothetical protein